MTHICSCGFHLPNNGVWEILDELEKIHDANDLQYLNSLEWKIDENIPILHCKGLPTIDKHVIQSVFALFIGTYKKLGVIDVTEKNGDILEWNNVDDTIYELELWYSTDYLYFGPEGKTENEVGKASYIQEILSKVLKIGRRLELHQIRPYEVYKFVEIMYIKNKE